jgi:hypothetical protein
MDNILAVEPNIHKRINSEEQELAIAAFLAVHPHGVCDTEVRKGPWSTVCLCETCNVLRTYELV